LQMKTDGGKYEVFPHALAVDGTSISAPAFGLTYIDSGTSFTLFPKDIATRLYSELDSRCQTPQCSRVNENCWRFNHLGGKAPGFPEITFGFSTVEATSTPQAWLADDYMLPVDKAGGLWCTSFLAHDGPQTILGASWMINKRVTFSLEQGRLGIGINALGGEELSSSELAALVRVALIAGVVLLGCACCCKKCCCRKAVGAQDQSDEMRALIKDQESSGERENINHSTGCTLLIAAPQGKLERKDDASGPSHAESQAQAGDSASAAHGGGSTDQSSHSASKQSAAAPGSAVEHSNPGSSKPVPSHVESKAQAGDSGKVDHSRGVTDQSSHSASMQSAEALQNVGKHQTPNNSPDSTAVDASHAEPQAQASSAPSAEASQQTNGEQSGGGFWGWLLGRGQAGGSADRDKVTL